MKKIGVFTLLIVFMLITVFACGSSKVCPAYSNNETEQTNNQSG